MRKIINYLLIFLVIPLFVFLGILLLKAKQYAIVYIGAAILACVPFFLHFETRRPEAREIVLIAILTALSVASRILFAELPFVKPVSAIVIISAIAFGKETGFLVGALTALLSNIYFGQGAWTPFQMFAWGIVGFIGGMLRNTIFFKKIYGVLVYGALSGVLFSMIMDVETVLVVDRSFNLSRYFAVFVTSLPYTLIYVVSNVVFLILLYKPLLKKLQRVKDKYNLFGE